MKLYMLLKICIHENSSCLAKSDKTERNTYYNSLVWRLPYRPIYKHRLPSPTKFTFNSAVNGGWFTTGAASPPGTTSTRWPSPWENIVAICYGYNMPSHKRYGTRKENKKVVHIEFRTRAHLISTSRTCQFGSELRLIISLESHTPYRCFCALFMIEFIMNEQGETVLHRWGIGGGEWLMESRGNLFLQI